MTKDKTFDTLGEVLLKTPNIEPDTGNIDARLIEAKITGRTKAILPVSLYGQPAELDVIIAIAARHGHLPVIEDAAQSFGATYKGRKSGNLSTIGCSSFFPSKPLGGYGDGGAIAQACRELGVHGQPEPALRAYPYWRRRAHGHSAMRNRTRQVGALRVGDRATHLTGKHYNTLMEETGIKRIQQRPDRTSIFAQYTIKVENREALQARLKAADIPSAVHYPVPLNEQPAYPHLCCLECTPVAQAIARRVLILPMHPYLTAALHP